MEILLNSNSFMVKKLPGKVLRKTIVAELRLETNAIFSKLGSYAHIMTDVYNI